MESIIDNATIVSASGITQRHRNHKLVREINLIGLDNIIESFLLNDITYIDESYWDLWMENTPVEWHQYYFEGLDKILPIKIEFDGFADFASNEMVFFILNTLINHQKNKTTIEQDFFSYTGRDFESYTYTSDELFEIDEILKEKWNWNYSHANQDHIDIVMMAFRTIKYLEYAENSNLNFVCHPIRNEFLSEIGYAYGLHNNRQYNLLAYDELKTKIIGNIMDNANSTISSLKERDKIIWKEMKIPLLPAIVYENSSNFKSIFREASKLRIKLAPFRKKIKKVNNYFAEGKYKNADRTIGELISFVNKMELGRKYTKVNYSASIGFPWKASVKASASFESPKYLRIFSDLSNRFNLPKSYIDNCNRIFPSIRWNKSVRESPDNK